MVEKPYLSRMSSSSFFATTGVALYLVAKASVHPERVFTNTSKMPVTILARFYLSELYFPVGPRLLISAKSRNFRVATVLVS